MANRLGGSFYRFSTVNRPTPAPAAAPTPEPAQPDPGYLVPPTRYDATGPLSPTRAHSPSFPTTHYRVLPEVEQKPSKSDRRFESGKLSHKQPDVIKIAGENIGAVMEITQSTGKREGGQIIKKRDAIGNHNIGDENDEASKDKSSHKGKETSSLLSDSFINTNFQSVNNSLVYSASLSHRDPGLHIAFSKTPAGDGFTKADEKHFES